MKTNANITLYNKHNVSGDAVYQRLVVNSVTWQNARAVLNLGSGGVMADNKVTVYIPGARGSNYLDPREWQALDDKVGKWTLQEGDILVRGAVTDEIFASFTASDLKAKYNDVLVISKVDPHLYGSPRMQHWEVGAK